MKIAGGLMTMKVGEGPRERVVARGDDEAVGKDSQLPSMSWVNLRIML